jgi:hypothetical protein
MGSGTNNSFHFRSFSSFQSRSFFYVSVATIPCCAIIDSVITMPCASIPVAHAALLEHPGYFRQPMRKRGVCCGLVAIFSLAPLLSR